MPIKEFMSHQQRIQHDLDALFYLPENNKFLEYSAYLQMKSNIN